MSRPIANVSNAHPTGPIKWLRATKAEMAARHATPRETMAVRRDTISPKQCASLHGIAKRFGVLEVA